jgi:hypothetical protein
VRLKFYDKLGNPQVVDVVRVVVETTGGEVLVAAMEYQPDLYYYAHNRDPDFGKLMRSMGLDRTVVSATEIKPPLIKDMIDLSDDVT